MCTFLFNYIKEVKGEKRMIKKAVSMCVVAVFALAVLVGCGPKMPDTYNKETVKEKAVEVVNLLNNNEYQAVADMYREDLQETTQVVEWENIFTAQFAIMGAVEKIESIKVKTEENPDDATGAAIVTVVCKYANGKMTYNVAFDGENNLIGFYLSNQK